MKKIALALIAAVGIGSAWIYPQLPVLLPVHWNIRSEVDSYQPKEVAIWFMPLLLVAMFIGFQVLPLLDPKKEKYALFKHEWEIMQTALLIFFVYMQFVVVYLALHPGQDIRPLIFAGLGGLFIIFGNYLSKVRQNYFIGIRTPWTLADENNWNKTHRFASWCFVVAGIVTLIEAAFPWYAPVIVFAVLILAAFLPTLYSLLLYKGWVK